MDTDDLSNETYDAIIKVAEKFHHDLTLQFGLLASDCKDESEYLKQALILIKECESDIEEAMEEIFYENIPEKSKFKSVLKEIKSQSKKFRKYQWKKERMKNGDKIILTEEQIKSIAEDLDIGMKVYVNLKTMEIKTIIDSLQHYEVDTEAWEDDINEIEENFDKYFEFEKMDSRESFRVMEDFVETVKDERLKEKLELGLSLSKPFRNFKDIIDDENEYRKQWFEFKDSRNIEFVKKQIERHNNSI